MKVKFLEPCEIEVVESYYEWLDDAETTTELFKAGDTTEFEVIACQLKFDGKEFIEDKNFVNVQFPDGSVSFGLSMEWFEILDN